MRYHDPPIAFLQLRAQKPQTFAALASIAFITLLLFMMVGFRAAFLDAATELPRRLQGDLFLFNIATMTALIPAKFAQHRLYQISAFDEVERVMPLYLQLTDALDPTGNPEFLRRVLVIGFPLGQNPLAIPELNDKLPLLKEGGVFLFDRLSRSEYKPIIQEVTEHGRMNILIRGGAGLTRITIKGLFSLGMNEGIYANLLTSDATFTDVLGSSRDDIHIGVIHLKSGVDLNEMQKKITKHLSSDAVVVRQKHEMLTKERELFEFKTPVGSVFRVGIGASVIIGIIVLYQILFQLISKSLREYATLKALGFSHGMLLSIVLNQAIILAVSGYVSGWFITCCFFYDYLTYVTNMKFGMTVTSAAAVFALVSFICLMSALFAIRKLKEADPADLFG